MLSHQLVAANAQITTLEAQLKQLQDQQTPPDPKATEAMATEAMAALVELAKALKLVAA